MMVWAQNRQIKSVKKLYSLTFDAPNCDGIDSWRT